MNFLSNHVCDFNKSWTGLDRALFSYKMKITFFNLVQGGDKPVIYKSIIWIWPLLHNIGIDDSKYVYLCTLKFMPIKNFNLPKTRSVSRVFIS